MLEKKFDKPKMKHRGADGKTEAGGDDDDDKPQGSDNDSDADLPPGSVTSRDTLILLWQRTFITLAVLASLFGLAALLCAVPALVVFRHQPIKRCPTLKAIGRPMSSTSPASSQPQSPSCCSSFGHAAAMQVTRQTNVSESREHTVLHTQEQACLL